MREIPSLQVLCLRHVGGKSCSAEDTFAKNSQDGSLSTASKLLRSYYERGSSNSNSNDTNSDESSSIQLIPMERIPAIGKGSARRKQANDVDLNHPWVAVLPSPPSAVGDATSGEGGEKENVVPTTSISDNNNEVVLYAEYNTPALDLLQSFIDSLVELSRMDDGRLGLHFFQEWKANVLAKDPIWAEAIATAESAARAASAAAAEGAAASSSSSSASPDKTVGRPGKRQRRRSSNSPTPTKKEAAAAAAALEFSVTDTSKPPPLGSLSLYNTILQEETIQAMVESKMTYHLAVLDMTGIQSLQDEFVEDVVSRAPHLQRLSVKNCRRLTDKSLECLSEYATQLTSLDVGGTYNLQPSRLIEMVAALPKLQELHASGLLWNDAQLGDLVAMRSWKALSLGFLIPGHVSANGLKTALISQSSSLQSLAIPFCEHIVDAALLGVLGRHLPLVECLDVRGNSALNSLTGWYDGRATIQPMVGPQPLFVLGRYSAITKASVEDTKRIHPLQAVDLVCSLESDGVGMGVRRYSRSNA